MFSSFKQACLLYSTCTLYYHWYYLCSYAKVLSIHEYMWTFPSGTDMQALHTS